MCMCIYVYIYIYTYIYIYIHFCSWKRPKRREQPSFREAVITHGSFLIRRQRGHPGVALPLVVSASAKH